ncbi:MAG: hypothetical protein AAF960_09675 [Bacteroidota bacterium]
MGYPIRGIIQEDYLYLHNFETNRWPAGDPITGYLNCDGSPTKTVCLNAKADSTTYQYWQWSFGKRPKEELYNIKKDPVCLKNLATNPEFNDIKNQLHNQLFSKLRKQEDPRMFGKGTVFDNYTYADSSGVDFYKRHLKGEKLNFGWVNASDFAKIEE